MSRLFVAILLLVAGLLVNARPAHAVDDPALDYHTLTTPHFWVHYYDGLEALAWKVAVAAEEAHELLVPWLEHRPEGRTHVYVNDKIDVANGSANVYGRKEINVYGMAPEADSVLGFYDDWIRVLVFHEYVHILHMDTIHGVSPYINAVIGQQLSPNQTMPRWYTEGLATWYESLLTRGGRIKGSLFQMWMRVAALEESFFDLGAVTGVPVRWPRGSAAYAYGSMFLDYVFEVHGAEVGTAFNHIYGGRLVPWSMNQIMVELTGKSFLELWREWQAYAAGKAAATRLAVRAGGETELEWITTEGGTNGYVDRRPGFDQMSFFLSDLVSDTGYAITGTEGTGWERLFDTDAAAGPAAWTPDGGELVYSESRVIDNVYRYQDLYAWNAATGSRRRLTHRERAREPAVSPDGGRLAYVRNRQGTMELVVRSMRHPSRQPLVLVSGRAYPGESEARWQQVSMPAWSPDGAKLVFSRWALDRGQRDLWLYDFAAPDGERLVALTDDFALDLDPHFGPDGLLYFSSDRNGIFNIYAMDLDGGTTWQVSNVVGGVFGPQLSGDGRWIYVTAYDAEGYQIARFPRPARLKRAPGDAAAREYAPAAYPAVDTSSFASSDYQPWRWMAPLLLTPDIGVLTSGAGFGAAVEGWDPIEHHRYKIAAGFTTGRELADKGGNLAMSYAYGGWPFNVSMNAGVRDYARTRSLFAADEYVPFIEREYAGSLRLSYPIYGLSDALTLSTSFRVEFTEFEDEPRLEPEPGDVEPSFPEQGWFNELDLSLRYSDVERYPESVSAEKGVSAGVSLGLQDPAIGSDFESVSFNYNAALYLPNPWIDRHVLAMTGRGGIIVSERRNPRRFFIGGIRPQDVLTSVLFQRPGGGSAVRGYPPGATNGQQYQLLSAEYRFPILELDQGFATVPVFLRQLKGDIFVDSGGAFDGFLADADYLTGVGGELILQTIFGYYLTGNLTLGYAHGLDEQGISEWYVLFGGGY